MTGNLPFADDICNDENEQFDRLQDRESTFWETRENLLGAQFDESFKDLIQLMLAKDPSSRPTATQVL